MAHIIPNIPPGFGPGKGAELALYDALQSQLPDDFFVYHGLRYLEEEKAAEGEVDFLILHRDHGLLSIECKGKGIRRSGTGQWFRLCEDGKEWPLKEDPFQQAQRTLKDLVKELNSRVQRLIPRLAGHFPFTHGYAVAFPLTFLDHADLPLNLQRRMVFDATDMGRLGERILDAYRFWKAQRPEGPKLLEHEFKSFRRKILHPKLHLTESFGARLQLDTEAFVRLSREQVLTLKGILSNPRLRVSGGAGTGKTVLALEAVKMLSGRGLSTLLLCYNQGLSRFLDGALEDRQAEAGKIDIHTFHALCRRAFECLEIPFSVPARQDPEASAHFWNETAPLVLLEALDKGKVGPWDAIVVDEGQDFARDWWAVIQECLRDRKGGSLIIFYDPRQEIFGRGCHVPEAGPAISLQCNFRNSRMIFEAMRELVPLEMELHPRCPKGVEVTRHIQKSRSKALDMIGELLKGYLEEAHVRPEQIVIITPHTRENSLLAGVNELAGRPLVEDPAQRQGAILHTTIGKFKGLESDIVILADIDPDDERCNVNARYVALSRGRHALHEFWKRAW